VDQAAVDTASWINTPNHAEWPDDSEQEKNPYIRWRKMLWSWHKAMERGWEDQEFIKLVYEIDSAVNDTSGKGFEITPVGVWENASSAIPDSVLWKDETQNVGGSHKARHLMGLLLHLAVDAVETERRLAISSCGNAAIGAATLAKAVGRPIDVFIPTWASSTIVNKLEQLEAQIHVCERKKGYLGDPCIEAFHKAVDGGALAFGVQATENAMTLDGGRTIGWELAEALKEKPVEQILIQIGGGALLTSCAIGLFEAVKYNQIEKVPSIWAVQGEGCAPFNRAWEKIPKGESLKDTIKYCYEHRSNLMEPWHNPTGLATGILDDITYDWMGVARSLLMSGGGSVVATEEQIKFASELVPSFGINTEPTGAASLAGAIALIENGKISHKSKTAVLLTGVDRSGT